MGKRVRDKKHSVVEKNNSSGAIINASASTSHHGRTWSILNIMKYHHWHLNVKKRHTHNKNGGGKNPEVDGPSGADNIQHDDPNSKLSSVKEMAVVSNSPAKHSVKARLKALLTHEIARKKGQHKRSSTYPVKPKPPSQFISIHNSDHSDPNLVSESVPTENHPEMVPHASETFKDFPSACSMTNKEVCVLCGTMFSSASTEHNSIMVHKHQKPPSEYHRALMKETFSHEEKSIHAKLLTTDVSPYLFKDFLDAFDMINSNKDLLLKFLQHQHFPLAYHSPNQQESTRKMKLQKSSSFPVPISSSSSLSSKVKGQDTSTMAGEIIRSREVQDGSQTQKAVTSQSESSEKSDLKPVSLDSSYYNTSVPAKVQNPRAIKRFKDLRQKVKHVLEESKNENRHIAMDAVYHKVPHGNKPPKVDTISPSEFGSFKKRLISPIRTSSLNESVWKYSHLYETCFNKKYNYPRSDMLKLKTEEKNPILKPPKSFQRFLSLPNLKDYFNQNEEPSSILPPEIPIRKFGERAASQTTSIGNITTPESDFKSVQKGIAIRSDSELVSDEDKESNQNGSIGIDDYIGKVTDSDMNESTSLVAETKSISFSVSSFLDDSISSDEKLSLTEDVKIKPWPTDGLDHLTEQAQELDIADYHELVVTSEYDVQKFGTMNKHLNLGIPELEDDTNRVAEFNYVKDVLELSGLSTTRESLSSWFSNEQPVDPTVYDELEGCLLFDPESSGYEESGSSGAHCNHLLLFDLINEVLIEIFGRSYSYCPKSLSSLCHVYPIPVGDQVVREVWALIKWYLNMNSELYPSLDYYVSKDLAKSDGWMNLQFDSECVGLEIDDLIFDDLLDEIISD